MMTCGHSPNGKDMITGRPVCVICQCDTVGESPILEGRVAYCLYDRGGKNLHAPVPSKENLAFFKHKPNKPHDSYYCGCMGWD